VGEIGWLRLWGWPAWVLWWAIHIYYLVGFRNRTRVMASWAWSYFTYRRGSRLITTAWRPSSQE
jgi:NADH dehydrogenase FAD-containing subunit